ncbi:MAG: cupin domain-containing protein [Pseudomonadota bacterium]
MGREKLFGKEPANAAAIEVVRYAELQPCFDAFIDTRTPGSDKKENFTIIGPGVSENPNQYVHIARPHGFNIGGARQPPGCVNSQHSHDTAEFFYVHTGIWSFNLGESGEDASATLGPGDAISIPTKTFRGFENIGEDTGFLFAVLGGDNPGRVTWAPYVFDMAEEFGLILLDNGSLIDTAKGEAVPPGMNPMPRTSADQVAALRSFDAAALRECCVMSDQALPGGMVNGVRRRQLVHPQGGLSWPHVFAVEELTLEPGGNVNLGSVSTPQVVFAHRGSFSISADSVHENLGYGDTATIAVGCARSLANTTDTPATALLVTGLPDAIAA